jgi:Alpha-glutamyl/putrescinyl thymine pyrophosphorylase clade 2
MTPTTDTDLAPDMDLRLPQYRREVFLRFYLHTLEHRSHPGAVYYLLPWLAEELHWTEEDKLWFAFLNGNTQHPVTSLMLMRQCPGPLSDPGRMLRFFDSQWARLPFDTDRRHWKSKLPNAVRAYASDVAKAGSQAALWGKVRDRDGWTGLWTQARSMYGFGRLSAFSYLEYLEIFGYGAPCGDLMLGDRDGSRSHRAGLEIVSGAPVGQALSRDTPFDPGRLGSLNSLADSLLMEAVQRVTPEHRGDVGYFTLESALCTYKSWHKPNRRYPGVYNDMLYNRLRRAEADWPGEVGLLSLFWRARRSSLPVHLRLEDSPYDPGLHPDKQNHYRLTGQTVMLGIEDPELWSEFDQAVADHRFGVRADARRMVL